MRKGLIFMSAFVVSFIVVYSWYYYRNIQWSSDGYVANADTIKHSIVVPNPYQPSLQKNIIYSAGIISALNKSKIEYTIGAKNIFSNVLNDGICTLYSGTYSAAAVDKLGEETAGKFPRHPPLKFENIKDGEKMLFAYVYRNIELPPAFLENNKGISFGSKKVRSIMYNGLGNTANTRFYMSKDGKEYALCIPVSKDEDAYWFHKDSLQSISDAWLDMKELLTTDHVHVITQGQEVLIPELDLFLEKTYTHDEMQSFFSLTPNDYKLVDDRIKLKTTTSGHVGNKEIAAVNHYEFGPSSFFCIRRKSASFPYIGILLHNPDILVQSAK